jgi:hypothetical protein
MIKNYILLICFIIIIVCLLQIRTLNNIVGARVVPAVQNKASYNTMCVRVVNVTLLNEFVSFHISQGFLTFVFYGNVNFTDINYLYGDFGLDLTYKNNVDNIEWDCILDSVFDPSISHVVILDNDQFIFPLHVENHRVISQNEQCQLLEEYSFIRDINNELMTKNTQREKYTSFDSKKAIIPIGKTSGERIELLRNYSMQTLFNECTVSTEHGIASFDKYYIENNDLLTDIRLLSMHKRISLGRR